MTLETYAKPMRAKKVSEIGTDDVLAVLTPLWQKRPETASRLRGRIERVLDFAKARGWRDGENPALWRGHLKAILPARQKLTRGHHAAMPYKAVPGFLAQLAGREAMAARGLEFLILTAARSGEVLGARWDEFDLEAGIWTVPAERMKAGREHRVPLSEPALAIIAALSETRVSDFVFPGQKPGRPLSGMAFEMLMRRMEAGAFTVHGFRSAFRDWAGDETSLPPRSRRASPCPSRRGCDRTGLPPGRRARKAAQADGGMGGLLHRSPGRERGAAGPLRRAPVLNVLVVLTAAPGKPVASGGVQWSRLAGDMVRSVGF